MSTIKVDTIKTTSNVEVYTAKAWVNFDGTTNTGGTCTIRASGNVSSVVDNGTGYYTINFATAMPDTNYTALTTQDSGGSTTVRYTTTTTTATGSFTFQTRYGTNAATGGGGLEDQVYVRVAIFR